jgi:hypothetical protein
MTLPSWLNPPFWYKWPSLPTELLSGALCFGLGAGLAALWIVTAGVHVKDVRAFVPLATRPAVVVGLVYELFFDRHGFSWTDVLQRVAGIVLAALLVLAVAQIV